MSVPSVGQFLDLLRESNLLTPDQWTDLRRLVLSPAISRRFARKSPLDRLPDAPPPMGLSVEDLAGWLVDRSWITRWQADMLLSGRTPILGRYRLLDCIGSGGMGAVFKAWHGGTGRIVALKVMADAIVQNEKAVARFHKEIQAVAALNHPNIVSAYDADCVRRMHFLVMEYVDGHDLGWFITNTKNLPLGWVCEVIRQAALGLHHAHERGMVHRDIKPTNVLVARDPESGGPLVKLLDLGLARFASETDADEAVSIASGGDAGLTQAGQVLGTPDYMSPEQALDTRRADARSDIFSLGCTLFRLLTHAYPFPGESVVEKIAARQMANPRRLRDFLPDAPLELEVILKKILARDPRQRYQSALEVAFALAPFAQAHAPSPTLIPATGPGSERSSAGSLSFSDDPRLREFFANMATRGDADAPTIPMRRVSLPRWSRRTWWSIAGGGVGLLLLFAIWHFVGQVTLEVAWPVAERKDGQLTVNGQSIGLDSGATIIATGRSGAWAVELSRPGYVPIRDSLRMTFGERRLYAPQWKPTEKTARQQALAALRQRAENFRNAETSPTALRQFRDEVRAFRGRTLPSEEATSATRMLAQVPSPLDGLRREKISVADLRLAGQGDPKYAPEQLVGIEGDGGRHFWNRINSLSTSHDGRWIAGASLDGTVRIFDRKNIDQVQILRLSAEPYEVVFSPTAAVLAIAGPRSDISLWRLEEDNWVSGASLPGTEAPLVFSGDGRFIAAHGRRKELVVWHVTDGSLSKRLAPLPGPSIHQLVMDHAGGQIAAVCRDQSVLVWNLAKDHAPQPLPRSISPCFSPGGDQLATGGLEGDLQIWNLATGLLLRTLELGGAPLGFSADGATLVSYRSGRVVVWDMQTGAARRTLFDVPPLVILSQSGEILVSGSDTVPDLRFWNLQTGSSRLVSGIGIPVVKLVWSENGARVVTADADFAIREWDLATGQEGPGVTPAWGPVAFDPDGARAAIATQGKVELRSVVERGAVPELLDGTARDLAILAWSPGGNVIVGAGGPGFFGATLRFWSPANRHELSPETDHFGLIRAMDFNLSGQSLATAEDGRLVALWDSENVARPRITKSIEHFPEGTDTIAFDRSGRWLAGAGREGKLFAWDTREQVGTSFENPSKGRIHQLEFAPGGKRIVAATDAGVLIWDVASGKFLKALTCRPGGASCLRFSPLGDRLAVSGSSATIWLWDWGPQTLPGDYPDDTVTIGPAGGMIRRLHWSADNRHLLTVNGNATIYVLRLPVESP